MHEENKMISIVMNHVSCTQLWLSGWHIIAAQREMDKQTIFINKCVLIETCTQDAIDVKIKGESPTLFD